MLKNERGSTLMLVILLVVVFTVIGVGLITMNISASKQVDRKEESVQARHLAEMGITHYWSAVDKLLEEYSEADQDKLLEKVEKLHDLNDSLNIGKYIVEQVGIRKEENEEKQETEIILDIKSTGIARNRAIEQVITAEVRLHSDVAEGEQNIESLPKNPAWENIFKESEVDNLDECKLSSEKGKCKLTEIKDVNNRELTYNDEVYFKGGLDLKKNPPIESTIIFNDNLILYGAFSTGTAPLIGKISITIKGDFIARQAAHILNNENPVVVCGDYSYWGTNDVTEGMLYVFGKVYEREAIGKGREVKGAYKTIPAGMEDYVNNACKSSAEPVSYEWKIHSDVNAEYK